MNVRAVTSQISGLRGMVPPPAARKIPMFRRRLLICFTPPVTQPLKIRHAMGHTIQNVGTPLNEIRPAQSRHV